jgi:hypothetical protein
LTIAVTHPVARVIANGDPGSSELRLPSSIVTLSMLPALTWSA